jgi:hypothetical protein
VKDLIDALKNTMEGYDGMFPEVHLSGAAKGYLDYQIREDPDKTYSAKEVLSLIEFLSNPYDM